jgi:LuxR family maltose regulon positive regulatory protein
MLSAPTHLRFTERQRQVIRLIAQGHSNLEIADRLGVSPRTAKAHSDALRTKLRVSRRRQIPAAFREATGEDPHALTDLEPVPGARDESRAP